MKHNASIAEIFPNNRPDIETWRPDGKKVPLKPHADRAGKLADLLAALVAKISDAKTSTSASASVAP